MNHTKRSLLSVSILSVLAISAGTAEAIEFGFFDARSAALANTGAASSNLINGGFHNPALLAAQEKEEDFSILIPSVGLRLADPNDLVSDIDAYQVAEAAGNNAGMLAALNKANGKAVIANGYGGVAMSFAGDKYAGGLLVNAYTLNSVRVTPNFVTPLNSTLDTLGIQVKEIGVPLATKLDVSGQKIAVGFTPKYVNVKTNDASQGLPVADPTVDGFLDNPASQLEDSGFNLDAGAVWGNGDGWRGGLVVRNLISKDYKTVTGRTITIDPQVRAGVSYNNKWVTTAFDLDLTENKPVGYESPTQMAAIGIEFNAYNWVQLRVGYMHNLKAASNLDKAGAYTAGIGINIYGVHLDAAVITNGNENDLGAYAQLGVNF
mgnify:CR=1 FL=1